MTFLVFLLGLVIGGFLGYKYGSSVQAKLAAAETEAKKVAGS